MMIQRCVGTVKRLIRAVVLAIGGLLLGTLFLFLGIIYIAIYVIWELMDGLLGRLA